MSIPCPAPHRTLVARAPAYPSNGSSMSISNAEPRITVCSRDTQRAGSTRSSFWIRSQVVYNAGGKHIQNDTDRCWAHPVVCVAARQRRHPNRQG